MSFRSQLQKRLTSYSLLWSLVFFAGLIAVSLPRTATSTPTPNQQSAPAAPAVRQIILATKDLVYDPVTQQIYASVPGSAGGIANTITKIDPVSGIVGASVPIGSEPGKLAISDNSQYIYVALDGAAAVRRFDLGTQTAGLQFSLGSGPSGIFSAQDIAVMPGQADSVAISRKYPDTSHAGVGIYDNGVARPTTTATFPPNYVIEFGATASRVYGYNNQSTGFDFSKLDVNAAGVSTVSTTTSLISGFDINMVFHDGLIYSTLGKVVDPENSIQVGTYSGINFGSLVLPDSATNRVYFLTPTSASTMTVKEFNKTTFIQTGSLTISGTSGSPGAFIKWGANGLAFRTSGGQVFFVSTTEIVPLAPNPLPSPTQVTSGVIQLPLATSDLIFDPNSQKVYATLPSSAGSFGNSLAAITPETGVMATPVFVGSEPRKLAIADTGQHVYAGLEGSASVRRFDTVTQTPGLQFALGPAGFTGPLYVDDMAVLPGSPNSLAVSRRNVGFSPRHEGVAIYDDGVARSLTTPRHTGANAIEFSSLASTLYGYNNETSEFGLYRLAVSASGVSVASNTSNVIAGFGVDIRFDNGVLYTTNGLVVNPETATLLGSFSGAFGLVLPDSAAGKVYFLNGSNLTAYDLNTFLPTGTLNIPGLSGTPGSLIKWGANGLAFRTESQVFFISTSAINPIPATPIPQPVQVRAGILELSLATGDLVYDSNTQRVYASLLASAGTFGNSIAPINPETGTMGTPVFVGSEPGKIAISGNNEFIYAGLDGAAAVRRFDVASQTPGLQFGLGSRSFTGLFFVQDMAVAPNDPNVVAVSRRNLVSLPQHEGVAIYDGGVMRSTVTAFHTGSNVIEFSSSASLLYGHNNETSEFGFRKMAVDANGVSVTSTTTGLISLFGSDIRYDNDRVYASTGQVINPNTATVVGTFPGVNSIAFVPDSTINRAFFVTGNTLRAFDLNTFLPAGSMTIPGINGTPSSMVRWGTNGLAFRTDAGQVFFIQTSLVSSAPNLLVNSLADVPDTNVGDAHCDTDGNLGNGDQCTLRAALQEANAAATDDAITFDVSLNGGIISLGTELDAIDKNITITGPGAAQLTVQRSLMGGTPDFRIFTINSGKTVTISGLTLSNGKVGSPTGAGIANSGSLTLNGLTISGNTITGGGAGAGIRNNGTLTVNNCVVSGNGGGGILSSSFGVNTSATINNSVISGNTGSGLSNTGANSIATMAINNSTISGNNASSGGGGVSNGAGSFTSRGFLTINNSTISGNSSNGGGGGLYNAAVFGNAATEVTINNSTISGNLDTSTFGGGGIFHFGNSGGSATLTINNGTVFGNTTNTGSGGGIFSSNQGGPTILNLRNTIVAGNLGSAGAAVSDISGAVDPAGSFNLIGDGTGMTGLSNGSNGNQVGSSGAAINPRLGPLASNGGPTQTHRLLISSPALDAAADLALTTLNGAVDNVQTTINVTDAASIPAGVGYIVQVDAEHLTVVSKSTNTLTALRGVNGTSAAAHASGASLYSVFDQRGGGFLRKRDSVDPDTVATVDIGAFEAQASIEDITDKSTFEEAPLSFGFSVGDAGGGITSVTASSNNPTLVPNDPANINVTGSGSTRTLNIVPAVNRFGTATITVTVNTPSESISDTFVLTVTPVADTPSVTNAQANEDSQNFSGLVITRNAGDGAEVTHFKITGITNGTLFKNDDLTPINNGDFILVSEGGAGLRFHPSPNFFGTGSFNVQASIGNTDAGLGGGLVTATIMVGAVAETPSVTNATTTINTQTSSGLVVTRNPIDGPEISHFRIENIQNGQLFKNDGVTQITSMSNVTVAEGNAGLKFTPGTNLISPGTTFSFQVRGATSTGASGFGGAATATITVSCNTSSVVTNTNDSGAGSLREAVSQACPGGTITFNIPTSDSGFSGGVYTITLASGELLVNKNLTITGLGRDVLTVRRSAAGGTPNFRIFTINSGITVAISGMTISNGSTAGLNGGGVLNSGTLSLSDIKISGNRTGDGVTPSQGGNGGGLSSTGSVTMIDSIVSDNLCGKGSPGGPGGSGGGIAASGTLTITNSTISDNQAGAAGMVPGSGGGIAVSGTVTITNSTISGNQTASGMSFNGNGGGISNSGTLRVTGSTISNNSSSSGGGGVLSFAGTVTLINSILSGNHSDGGGGGVNGLSPVTIINCSVTNNTASAGGGLLVQTSNSTVINTTVSGNSSTGNGGGLYVSSTVTLSNLTVVNNRSDSDNSGDEQGGGFFPQGPQTIKNSIVAGNFRGSSGTTADDITGTLNTTDSSYNLIGTGGSGGLTNDVNNNQVGVADPRLGPLANHGGPTQTIVPLPTSPAIDAGNVSNLPADTFDLDGDSNTAEPLPVDQRGFARVVNTNFDIGAVEASYTIAATAGTPQSAAINSAFATPLQATVKESNVVLSGVSVTFTAPAAGASGTFPGGATTVTVTTDPSGIATAPVFTANGTAGGPYNVVASVSSGVPSATFSLTNNQAATATSVASSVNPSNFGQSVTFTATVIAGAGTPVGMVQFRNGPDDLGAPVTCVAGVGNSCTAQVSTASLSVGPHAISAIFSGNGNFLASTGSLPGGQVVNNSVSLSINDVSITEGDSGTKTANFTVTLSAASAAQATVNFATANGSATAGSDYQATSGTLTFTPGQTTQPISVTINADTNTEANETFLVNLSTPVNATISDGQGSGTITNDDVAGGFISFSQANYTVGESGGFTTITVTRSNDLSAAVTVDYATAEDSTVVPCATANSIASSRCDFTTAVGTLRFAAGESSQTFLVLISQDNYVEGAETVAITLSNPTGGAALATPSTATLTITDDASEPATNPIDTADAFVRQHYHDFLNREPDAPGLAFWSNQITECQQPGATCSAEVRRINVSAAFFLSIEFQETGYLVYRTYKSAYGNISGTPVPLRLNEFLPDTQQIGKGVQVGVGNWEALLEANKVAFALDFVSRARFMSAYPTTLTPAEFVDALFAHGGVTPSAADRDAASAEFGGAGNTADTAARARALRRVAENETLKQQEFNRAFVLMQYFGYLRRNPNDAPEANLDFGGYNFWLGKLNEFNGNFVNAEMVKAFLVSGEYRGRFGP